MRPQPLNRRAASWSVVPPDVLRFPMKRIFLHLPAIALTAWVGGLWSIGYLAVPLIFHAQPDRQLSGMLAGEMLKAVGYLGLTCGGILLLHKICTVCGKPEKIWREQTFWVITTMLVIGLIIQFGLSPVMANLKIQALPLDVMHSAFADRFKILHGISSILYLMESLLGLYLLVKSQPEQTSDKSDFL
ncbi:MAG: DUF4149 domain-containing protein [Gallionella sp.]|nr:DUF4149 domain-containing protein [Gallionella sp.]